MRSVLGICLHNGYCKKEGEGETTVPLLESDSEAVLIYSN